MVLDYSKINAFERDQLANPTLSLDDVHSKSTKAVQTKLSTHGAIDLAILTEEVIEGVATGHAFDGPQYRAARHKSWDCNISGKLPEEVTILIPRRPDVELIIDISNQDWIYWCEPGSIRRIVMNLVGNALKYTNAGFVHVKLEKQIAQAEGIEYGILTVSDSGQGISPAYLKDKLYKPFAQESNQAPGVGLGLSLVKSIVTTIDGQIHIESTVDVGTKATVRFPLTRLNDDRVTKTMIDVQERGKIIALYQHEEVEATTDQQEAWRLLRQSLTAYLSSNNTTPTHSVLVVDDNTINLRLLQVGMKKRGYASVSSASDGLQAVNTYRTLLQSSPPVPPSIILMDLSMPIMNGFEATRQIREIETEHNSSLAPSQTPHHSLIIALTGLASVRDQKEAYTAGVDSYIMKPVSFAKLTTLLVKWTVDGKSAEAENGNDRSATAT
ncbi:hypothetical protein G6514_007439 [Epicoccum nigrum]|nr:hypothetical protein G6514_007439 [Epicoccum nigrum]